MTRDARTNKERGKFCSKIFFRGGPPRQNLTGLQVETHREGTLDVVSVVLEYQLHFSVAQGTVLLETSIHTF